MNPINPMTQVNAMPRRNNVTCPRTGTLPHTTGPKECAPFNISLFVSSPTDKAVNVLSACGRERPMRILAGR